MDPQAALLVTFLRSHPAYGYHPGQSVLIEMASARVLIADGFAEEAAAGPVPVPFTFASVPAMPEMAMVPAAAPASMPEAITRPEEPAPAPDFLHENDTDEATGAE